jgi:hypothetical protein
MTQAPPFTTLPEPDVVIVVYDAKTGAVRHVHQEINLPGAAKSSPAQSRQAALDFARDMAGKPGAALEAVALAPQERAQVLQSSGPLRFDLKQRKLVAAAPPRSKATARRKAKPAARRKAKPAARRK